MNKIILINYSLSIYFAGKKKELYKKGTWFLFSSELFCILVSISMALISVIPFKVPSVGLIFMLVLIWYLSFYFTKSWTLNKTDKIVNQIKDDHNFKLYQLLGILLYFGSFFLFLLVGILTFEGYLVP